MTPLRDVLESDPGVVWGWRGIARYMGRGSVRTMYRWHRWRPFPLSRIGPHVCAPKAALDLWVLNAPKVAKGAVRTKAR